MSKQTRTPVYEGVEQARKAAEAKLGTAKAAVALSNARRAAEAKKA